ncbi:FAD dependent oxidoreductase-domain-containing protein [Xylariales sp. AK1849]|nr:FAD dependent oxidoreductase-domain-containing protein [Xylariales sp. AK1849]
MPVLLLLLISLRIRVSRPLKNPSRGSLFNFVSTRAPSQRLRAIIATMTSKFPAPNPTASFWLTQPHRLASYRSSDTTPDECDIAIIGTGLAGVATAYHLLTECKGELRPRIVLFEARQACSGATGRNGGHIKVRLPSVKNYQEKYGPAATEEFVAWVASQRAAMKATAEKERIDCDLLVTRSFDSYFDPTQASTIKAFLEEQRQAGATWTQDVQWLEGPNLERITGVKGLAAAASVPALSLWPYKFVTSLLERVVELGAFLYTDTPVEAVKSTSQGALTLTTPRGATMAKRVIHSTNAYCSALLPQYEGVIVPYRGQNSILVPLEKSHHPHLTHTYNLFHTPQAVDYLVPRPDGNIILGGGTAAYRENTPDRNSHWFDSVDDSTLVHAGVKTHFDEVMERCFRGWEHSEARTAMTWSGIMGITPDGIPHVGQVPGTDNQWILAGFNGGGMPLIFTATREIALMVLRGATFEETNMPKVFKTTEERLQFKFT